MKSTPEIKVVNSRLYADVQYLTNIKPARQAFNPAGIEQAATYIYQEFKKISERVSYQEFQVNGQTYKNVICTLGPGTGERIILGAHYDVCGNQPGADDNASGVAGLLELARLLHAEEKTLKYRIDLVSYCLEEPPFFKTESMGSAVHAKSLKKEGVTVKAMVCLEMIGYFSEEKGSQRYPVPGMDAIYPDKANFISVVGDLNQNELVAHVKKYMLAGSAIDVQSLNAPASIPGVDFSDHLNYWANGYPAVMITNTSFYRNPNYHQVTDTLDTLDFAKMAEVVKGVYWAVMHL
ncbi:M28 family peptidase [Adhaeribacter swui]|uniref:M28 family peptidase n=2 Tax=Adhaeribacter swui TaxID=2086471 RepID=A0A7G7GF34_9BACT|nr:M28 family peptidase [Adhaeribacter swui]